MKTYIIGTILCLMFINSQNVTAQRGRFLNDYPLAYPSSTLEQKVEFEKTITAMMGGIKILESPNTTKAKGDKEAYSIENYKTSLEKMALYASNASIKAAKDQSKAMSKVTKAIKGSRYASASAQLLKLGAKEAKNSESLFFIWRDYMIDIDSKMPWVQPMNIKTTRTYRMILDYTNKKNRRPFGIKAELGAVVADGAQALSNCLENPQNLEWKGGSKIEMSEGDQLQRLAGIVAFYNWRKHDVSSGKRAAHIDTKIVQLLQKSLYDVVRSIQKKGKSWDADPAHGENLLKLFETTIKSGWSVNGDKAQKN